MINKKSFMLLVVLILLFTLSASSAIDFNDTNDNTKTITSDTTVIDKSTTNTINIQETTTTNIEEVVTNEDNNNITSSNGFEEKSIKKSSTLSTKSAKESMTLTISDYTCNIDDIVHVSTVMNPSGVTDGVLMYSLDDDLLGTCNIANVGTGFDIDTYGYDVGVHTLTVEFTASLTYESTSASSTLTITKPVNLTSTNTSLVSGIFSPIPVNVTITSSDEDACGDVDLYMNNVLVKTYENVEWNNLNISIPEVNIINKRIVLPEYCNSSGNYTWKLVFKDNEGYVTDSIINGSLEMMDHVEVFLTDEKVVGYMYDDKIVNFTYKPYNAIGSVYFYIEDHFEGVATLLHKGNDYCIDDFSDRPGEYQITAQYEVNSNLLNPYFQRYGLDSSFIGNGYPKSALSNPVTYTILKTPVNLVYLNMSYDDENNILVTMDLDDMYHEFDDYYWGYLNISSNGNLITTIDLDEFYDDDSNTKTVINFTIDKQYNHKSLKIEYYDKYFNDDLTIERIIDLEEKQVTLNTPETIINAHVGDLVEIPYTFNDSSVNDGKISISYGGSEDNITTVSSASGIICFDTTDYMQGEYDLVLRYYDSYVYHETSIPITLNLYQPTSITADKETLNVTLGKGNTYTVNFETNRDSWDDVIWGSIDVYVDDRIIDTLIVDDDTGNLASIVLDDYNLEDLTPGQHNLRAVFTSDDPYVESSEVVIPLNISGELIIEVPELVNAVQYKDYNITPVSVYFNGKKVTQGNLTFSFGPFYNFKVDLNSTNGIITQNASYYDTGVYTVNVEYHDDNGRYPDANTIFTLIVRTDTPAHFATTYNTAVSTDVYIGLRDNRGILTNRTVNITLPNGSRIENAYINSTILYRFTVNYLPGGENTIWIDAEENLTYTKLNQSYTFNVNRVKTAIVGTMSRKIINDSFAIALLKMNQTNHHDTIPNGTIQVINIETNEIIGTGITNDKGSATIITNITQHGDYQLKLLFPGNEYFEPSEKYVNVTIPKLTTRPIVTVNNDTLGNTSIEIRVEVIKRYDNITNAPITITFPDNTQINTNTGETGIINITLDLPVGENNITVEYTGQEEYENSSNIKTIIVKAKESNTIGTITNNTAKNVTVEVHVTDKLTGENVISGNVEIKDKDENIVGTGSIDINGKATITTSIKAKEINELTVYYLGNNNYTSSSYKITDLYVVGRLSDIQFTSNNSTLANISINVTVFDPITKETIPNATIIITYPDGNSETTTTDSNGNYTITHNLPVGENTINVEFLANDEYNTTSKTYTFTVTQRESTTTASISNNTIANTTITVTVTDKTTGEAVTSGNVEVVNVDTRETVGRGTLDGTNTLDIITNIDSTGTYNLRVDFKGNTNYTSSSYTLEAFNVEKRESQINTNVTSDVYQNTTITVKVIDQVSGENISNAPVTITLPNGDTINKVTDNNGSITVDLNLPVGENTLTITYTGNDEYNTTTETVTVNVTKRASTITAEVTNSSIANTTINVTITDTVNGNPITSGDITVKDTNTGNTVGSATLNGENSALIVTNLDTNGTYDLTIEYSGNTYYNSSQYTIEDLTLTGRLSEITTTITNNTNGNITINITVKDPITDTPIPNAKVNITYSNGSTEEVTTDENGTIIIHPDLATGENNITITYPGDDTYNNTVENITVNVDKRETITTATVTNNTVRNTTITVTILDKTTGDAVNTGTIEIINSDTGALIATGTLTGTNTIDIPLNIAVGSYNLTVNYIENSQYKASSTKITSLAIEKRDTIISVSTVNDSISDTRINVTVKDPITGEVITYAPITITLPDGQTIDTHTGSTGTTTVTLTLPAKNQTINITYNGNNQYNTTTTSYTIDVQKLESKITLTKQTGYIGENITFTATITDTNGNPINGGRVVFKLNDVTLKDTTGNPIYATVENGKASISYYVPSNYQAKTYKLSAVYGGNNQYLESRSNTPLVNLKQRQAKLTVTPSGNVKVNQTVNFHVTVTDKRDPTREVQGYILFKIDGITLTDENGTILVPLNNNMADYTFTSTPAYSVRAHTITALLVNSTYVRSQADNKFNVTDTTIQLNLNKITTSAKTATLTGTITDTNGNNVIGTNKLAVKIDGSTIKNSDNTTQFYYTTDGQINIPINTTNIKTGEHTIEVVTEERNVYTSARENTTLTVNENKITKTSSNVKTASITNKELVNIEATQTITTINESNQIKLTIKDTQNKQINTGTIEYQYNGKTIATSKINTGTSTLNYKFNTAGTYKIKAIYKDTNQKYETTTKTFNIQVTDNRIPVTLTANNQKTEVGETLTYTITTHDKYGNKINTGTITTKINGQTITQKVTNGINTIPITINKAGTYQITNTYTGTQQYQTTTKTNTITITKKTPKLTIQPITATAGTNTNITIRLTTQDNTPLDGKIIIKYNNKTKTIQAKDGQVKTTINIPIKQANKKNTLNITYNGNNYYNSKTITSTFTPSKKGTLITIDKINPVTYTKTTKITGKLTDKDENTLKNTTVEINIAKKTYKTKTNNKGIYTLNYKPTNAGKYTVTTAYTGNNYYTTSKAKITLTVNKKNTTITINKIATTQYSDKVTIKGKYTDSDKNPLKQTTLKININGKTTTTKTNQKGEYAITTTANTIGTNNITISYAGNTKYNKATTKTTYKVTPITTKITLNKINTTKKGKTIKITGKLTDKNGKTLKNTTVNIKIKNKTYNIKTTSTGVYTLNYKTTTIGTNNITVTWKGNSKYTTSTAKTTFKVAKT